MFLWVAKAALFSQSFPDSHDAFLLQEKLPQIFFHLAIAWKNLRKALVKSP